ncbi:EAL domain-containing protein [Amphiplicatus metriothermophilus]|uniref:EAL domain-containing protein n=1 Tax=Amphiplicatus metriothermophilus TaxID=1519374 RepID=UPI0011789E84|nr:EAL domain-containing protein [Amphiplicatus metriothermophilus]MBB5518666.1 EAL domain-containing protein (putative c-di-GMP-specific phosphodiesterase class I) [Amphiplicatus metriothermophilus]
MLVAVSGGPTAGFAGMAGLGEGAIAGAFVVGAAFLAGYAVFRRSAAAACALAMVVFAGALEFAWLGLSPAAPPAAMVLLQGLFAAAAILFLSTTVRAARDNALLGGLMFAGALVLAGLGIINLVGRGDASGLMRFGLAGVGVFAVALAVSQALRDPGARLVLPGAIVALGAAALAAFGPGANTLAPHALFAFGVLAASIVALTDGAPGGRARNVVAETGLRAFEAADSIDDRRQEAAATSGEGEGRSQPRDEEDLLLSQTRLAQVLDYAGVAVWDWMPGRTHHSRALEAVLGAKNGDAAANLGDPEAIVGFLHPDDAALYRRTVLAREEGDGAFDAVLRLKNGRRARFRGARAVEPSGEIERLVVFIEQIEEPPATAAEKRPAKDADPLAASFSDALAKGEIQADFQPIVDLESGRVAGFETLARWRGGEDGAEKAAPEALVRAANAAGRGGALARFALREAAAYLAEQKRALGRDDLFVAFNASLAQLDDAFAEELRAVMAEHGLAPKSLVLELTETEAISDKAAATRLFKALKEAGAALAFDDFGAGFSSLSNLRAFAFDYLKIDKSFVAGLGADGGADKIVRAMAGLGRDLGMTVIAEGVETKEAADAARAAGCALGQGFALGEPAPKARAENAAPDPKRPAAETGRSPAWAGDLR